MRRFSCTLQLISVFALAGLCSLTVGTAWADEFKQFEILHAGQKDCIAEIKSALQAIDDGDLVGATAHFAVAEGGTCAQDDGYVLSRIAFIHRLQHEPEKALDYYERALPLLKKDYASEPAYVNALYNLGYLQEERRDWKAANGYYEKALTVDPGFENARSSLRALRLKLARMALDANRPDAALIHASKAYELLLESEKKTAGQRLKDHGEILVALVKSTALTGDATRAGTLSRELLPNADEREALDLADFWEGPGQNRQMTLEALRRAADAEPKRLGALMRMASLEEEAGDWPAAIAVYEEATRRDGRQADVWYALGAAQHSAGNDTAARSAFKKALSVDPSHVEASDALRQLGGH